MNPSTDKLLLIVVVIHPSNQPSIQPNQPSACAINDLSLWRYCSVQASRHSLQCHRDRHPSSVAEIAWRAGGNRWLWLTDTSEANRGWSWWHSRSNRGRHLGCWDRKCHQTIAIVPARLQGLCNKGHISTSCCCKPPCSIDVTTRCRAMKPMQLLVQKQIAMIRK
jgi:hypothetical protein